MIQLDLGNVLLKPSHRRQVMGWLRRSLKLGERLGKFVLSLKLSRRGRNFDVRANVQGSNANFSCHCRSHDWRTAMRDLTHQLVTRLHSLWILRSAAA